MHIYWLKANFLFQNQNKLEYTSSKTYFASHYYKWYAHTKLYFTCQIPMSCLQFPPWCKLLCLLPIVLSITLDYVTQHPPMHYGFQTYPKFSCGIVVVYKPQLCYQGGTLITYLVNPPSLASHYIGDYPCNT